MLLEIAQANHVSRAVNRRAARACGGRTGRRGGARRSGCRGRRRGHWSGGVGAAALAPAAAGAFSAGFAAAAGAAAGAALTLLAGVCAWTTDANEIIPATADNQKALLRRITTLSRRDFSIDTGGFQSPAPRLERRMEPQAPSGIFYCASLPAKSDFHTSSRGCASWGRTPPRRMRVYNSATAGLRPLGTGGRACVSAVRPDPPARRSRSRRPAGRRTR